MLFEMCAGYELPSFKPNSTHLSDVEIYPQVQILSFCSLFASAFFLFHFLARFVTNYITHYCSICFHRFVKNTNSYVNNVNNDKYGRYFISLSMTYMYVHKRSNNFYASWFIKHFKLSNPCSSTF